MPTQMTKWFRPTEIGTEDNWILYRGADKIIAVDPGEPLSHDGFGSYLGAVPSVRQSFRIDREFPDSMGTIYEVRVHVRNNPTYLISNGVKVAVALTAGPTWVESAVLSHGGPEWGESSAALARPGGGGWTEADLRDTTFQFSVENGAAMGSAVTSLWVEVDYDPTDESAGAIPPEFPSRKLRRFRLPIGVMKAELRGDALDIDLLKEFEVSHSGGPKVGSKGWGEKVWERRHFSCFESELDHNRMTVHMKAVDLHDRVCMFWHTGISPYNFKSDEYYPDGPALLHPGSTETFVRTTKAWILNEGNVVVELAVGIKRIGPQGILLEGPSLNYIVNSSFFDGTTGWTLTGAGSSSLDTDQTLFHDEVAAGYGGTNQSLKLTYVDGLAGRSAERVTSSGFNASDNFAVTYWYKNEDDAYPGRFFIRNAVTTNYYNVSTGLWQAGFVSNPLPASSGQFVRHVQIIENDVTSSTILVACRSPESPGAGDHYCHFAHVQAEWKPGAPTGGMQQGSSPIPTFNAAVQRTEELLKFTNNVGRRIWPAKRGTFICRLTFQFDGPIYAYGGLPPDLDFRGVSLFVLKHDVSNFMHLLYHVSEKIHFISKIGGVKYLAIFDNFTAVKDQPVVFVCRWTSGSGGELDLPSRTHSVFVNGVKGATEDQAAADLTEVDTGAEFHWGVTSGFGYGTQIQDPGAAFSHIEILPWCLTDEEIKARP